MHHDEFVGSVAKKDEEMSLGEFMDNLWAELDSIDLQGISLD